MEELKTFGLNRGIFCGKVVSLPVLDHTVTNPQTQEIVKEYYLFELEVEFENKNKTVRDVSILPFLASRQDIEKLGEVELGDILSVKGRWRAYDRSTEEGVRKIVSRVQVGRVKKVEDFTHTRNKVEFHGYLKGKLFKAEFDDNGKPKRDENGRLIPVLDEEGNIIPWTRKNQEGHRVNDITLRVKKEIIEDGKIKFLYQDYIPAIAYGVVARQICDEIDVNTPVLARGYIRRRPKYGYEGEYVYEAVIVRITPVKEKKEEKQENNEE